MTRPRSGKTRPPLDASKLDELALHYVGRFATSRSKLAQYLNRKVRERGWAGEREPDVAALVERLSSLGYVDDKAFAMSKARSLTARGYGGRRVGQALGAAGIDEEDRIDANDYAEAEAVDSALRFARKKALGPFGHAAPDPKQRERHLAAMVRAGHAFGLSKMILNLQPGDDINPEALRFLR